MMTIAIPGRPGCRKGARVPAQTAGRNSRSNSDRASIGEAAGVGIAMPPLQNASQRGYAPCANLPGSTGLWQMAFRSALTNRIDTEAPE